MASAVSSGQVYRFGLFEANLPGRKLTRKGVPVKIQDQPFRALALLLQRSGDIVSREELTQELWPEGTYVDFEGSVNATIKKLRAAIDDNSENPLFIETVPRQGYRFIAPISVVGTHSDPVNVVVYPESVQPSEQRFQAPWISRSRFRFIAFPVLVIVLLAVSLGAWRLSRRAAPKPAPRAALVAVLPFANDGAGPDFDYLRFAIANDLASDLVSSPSLSVRPFASTKRYGTQPVDRATAGRELGVNYVVAGGFARDDKKLRVHMELLDVAQKRSIWTDELTISPEQLIALHQQLAFQVAHGLLVAMNLPGGSTDEMPKARNEQALNLFLHSLAIPLDPGPNQLAIRKLEESVSLDDQYEPAWEELCWRYYIDYSYGSGGEPALAKALEAQRHAEEFPNSTANTITIRVELGDLNGAYKEAATLLRKRPQLGNFHYEMSYVLRYAGLLEEAGEQCDAALALDPGYNVYRSCATPFIFMGDYDHALRFIRLDENSGFAAKLRMLIALRTGNAASALAESDAVLQSGYKFAYMARLFLHHAPAAQLKKAAAELERDPRSARDPEVLYLNAAVLSFSRQGDAALRELRKAIKGNHCSYPDMDKDPLFDPIRQRPEFAELRQAGIQCQTDFLDSRRQINVELQSTH